MWWLLYVGSTVYVLTDAVINEIYFHKRFKEDGYKYTVKNHIGIPEILLGSLLFGAHLIPVFNLVFPLANRDKEAAYDERINYMLEAGKIEEADEVIKPKKVIEDNDSIREKIDEVFKPREIYHPLNKTDNDDKGYSYKKKL